jgi:hypothetical protein
MTIPTLSDAFSTKDENEVIASINARGIGGFFSDIRVTEEQSYNSTVPDFPVEDGSFIQDHVILFPVEIKVVGKIGPIHFAQKEENFLSTISNTVDTLSALLPKKTAAQLRKIRSQTVNIVNTVDSYISGFNNIFDKFSGDKEDLLKLFNDFMIDIRNNKKFVDIQMSYKTHKNMIITSFVIKTDNEANMLDYEFHAKNIIIAKIKFTENVFKKGVRVENSGILEPKEAGIFSFS